MGHSESDYYVIESLFMEGGVAFATKCYTTVRTVALRHYRMPKKYVANGIRVEAITTPSGIPLDMVIDIPKMP